MEYLFHCKEKRQKKKKVTPLIFNVALLLDFSFSKRTIERKHLTLARSEQKQRSLPDERALLAMICKLCKRALSQADL